MPLDIVHSVCPHECPSTCALDVERLSPTRIGKVRGSGDNSYTAGVVCAKVARYAERQHHPDRPAFPMRRVGGKDEGLEAFQRISWDQALDETASALEGAAARHGREAVRLGNRRGSIVVHVRPFDGLQPGVVVVESIWPNNAFEEGSGINTLTRADVGPPKGGAVFHDTAIWMRPA